MRLVLDCSVVCGFIFEDEHTPYAVRVGETLRHTSAVIPSLFVSEIANVLHLQERKGRWSASEVQEFFSLLEQLPIEIVEVTGIQQSRALAALARQHALTAYDASYLSIALAYGIPLATEDKALKAAATAEGLFFAA